MKNSTATLLIIVSLALGVFYAYPSYKKLETVNLEKKTFSDALNDAKELKELQNNLLSKYQSLNEGDLENLKKVVPEYFDGENLVSVINNIALSHNMRLFEVSIIKDTVRANDPNKASSPYQTKEISFVLKGDYKSFILSLQDIEKSMLLMDLKNISIKRDQKSSDQNSLDFEVKFNTYSIR